MGRKKQTKQEHRKEDKQSKTTNKWEKEQERRKPREVKHKTNYIHVRLTRIICTNGEKGERRCTRDGNLGEREKECKEVRKKE